MVLDTIGLVAIMAFMVKMSNAEYERIHIWLREKFGKAKACENPNCDGSNSIYEYALRAGKRHKKLRSNYMTLCRKCHRKYDIEHQNTGHHSRGVRLSMKLLWEWLSEFKSGNREVIAVSAFLKFVDERIKAASERHETPTTTKRKSLTK